VPDPLALVKIGFALASLGVAAAIAIAKTASDSRFVPACLFLSRGLAVGLIGTALAFDFLPLEVTVWVGRAATLLMLLGLLVAVKQRGRSQLTFRDPGIGLWLGALALFLATTLSNVMHGAIDQRALLAFAGLTAALLSRFDVVELARVVKPVLGSLVLGTGLVVLLQAPLAWFPYEESLIPALPLRLVGILQHPNTLGPTMLLYLIVDRIHPSPHRGVRIFMNTLAGSFLVLAQSKTALGAAALVFVILWATGPTQRRTAQMVAALLLAGVLGLGSAVVETRVQIVSEGAIESTVENRTLTGRTQVWEIGMDAFRSSPWLGAGPDVFVRQVERTGQEWAAQAHNQYVQTLAKAGLVGFVGLVAYVLSLCYSAVRVDGPERGPALALITLLLLRSITEANLEGLGLDHLTAFCFLLAWERARAQRTLDVSRMDLIMPAPDTPEPAQPPSP
jgi:O-antigen ligase